MRLLASTEEEATYSHEFIEACHECGIPARRLTAAEGRGMMMADERILFIADAGPTIGGGHASSLV